MIDKIFINDQMVEQYHEEGYFAVEGLFTADEVEGVRNEITKIIKDHAPAERGLVQAEQTVAEGKEAPESAELSVRKLAKMEIQNDFFQDLAFRPGMVGIAISAFRIQVSVARS